MFNISGSDFLKYMSLISSIPMFLKNKLETDSNHNNNNHNNSIFLKLLKTKKKNKCLYKYQLKNDPEDNIVSQGKWLSYFEKENIEWDKIYSNIYSSTIDTKL